MKSTNKKIANIEHSPSNSVSVSEEHCKHDVKKEPDEEPDEEEPDEKRLKKNRMKKNRMKKEPDEEPDEFVWNPFDLMEIRNVKQTANYLELSFDELLQTDDFLQNKLDSGIIDRLKMLKNNMEKSAHFWRNKNGKEISQWCTHGSKEELHKKLRKMNSLPELCAVVARAIQLSTG